MSDLLTEMLPMPTIPAVWKAAIVEFHSHGIPDFVG
jgi:hypothetical protein